MGTVRLQKYLAECGIASRRKCEELIANGQVKVNGDIVTEPGTKVDALVDKIEFRDKNIELKPEKKVYIALYKPVGYVTTVNDEKGRSTVMELIKGIHERVVPVGRLDMYTSGLLLLSNDGEFINKITHPSHEMSKTYVVKVKGIPSDKELEKLRNGVRIDDFTTSPAKVEVLLEDKTNNISRLKIEIHEGKNRQVRKMVEAIGYSTITLKRESIDGITLEGLERGKWRFLSEDEVKCLMNC